MGNKSIQFRDLKRQYEHIKESVDFQMSAIINSTSFISGFQVKELEEMLASFVGVKHCISCGNGTDAITIALRALIPFLRCEKDKAAVFVPDFTFFSTGECPASLGFPVYFVDVKTSTFNMDPSDVELKMEKSIADGYTPSIIIAVNLFGQPAEYPDLRAIADRHNMFIIEDAAQGFGGAITVDNEKYMACGFGDISTTSFFPAKPFGCYGDGGAIFTNNDCFADLSRSIAVHGKDTSNLSDPMAKYNNVRLGYNSRLDTLQAGILLAKFPQFKDFELDAVNKVAESYTDRLKGVDGITTPTVLDGYYSSWAQYTVILDQFLDRDKIQSSIKDAGIPTMVYYKKPMHKQVAFKGTVSEWCDCPETEKLCDNVLCLPIHPYLEDDEVEFIVNGVKKALK